MFQKENIVKILICVVVLLILGGITVALVLDPNAGYIKKKNNENNTIMYATDVVE